MYNFLKMDKEVAYNSDIPHSSCLCEVSENVSLLAKGLNSILNSSDILSPTAHEHTCDLAQRIACLETLGDVKAGTIVI